jgi:two-component system chemotaxis response regulator CheY
VTKTIMMVDESSSTRQLAGFMLRQAGYEFIEASDGKDALRKLNGQQIHLLICDVNMSSMDDLTFVKKVKNLPDHKCVPIIMLTTGFIKSSREQAKEAGVKAWMLKPFDQEQLLEMVARFALPQVSDICA